MERLWVQNINPNRFFTHTLKTFLEHLLCVRARAMLAVVEGVEGVVVWREVARQV